MDMPHTSHEADEKTTAKKIPVAFRCPPDLLEQLHELKSTRAHATVLDTKLLIAAVKFYVEQGMKYGLDGDLRVKDHDAPVQLKQKKVGGSSSLTNPAKAPFKHSA